MQRQRGFGSPSEEQWLQLAVEEPGACVRAAPRSTRATRDRARELRGRPEFWWCCVARTLHAASNTNATRARAAPCRAMPRAASVMSLAHLSDDSALASWTSRLGVGPDEMQALMQAQPALATMAPVTVKARLVSERAGALAGWRCAKATSRGVKLAAACVHERWALWAALVLACVCRSHCRRCLARRWASRASCSAGTPCWPPCRPAWSSRASRASAWPGDAACRCNDALWHHVLVHLIVS